MKKTPKTLIDITFELLYKKGYCATSLIDILELAKLTKGAMYYHFKNKNELVLASMKCYLDEILISQWVDPLENSEKPKKAIINQINLFYKAFENKDYFLDIKHGCPLSNFVLDMSDKDELFFTYLHSVYERWQISVKEALIRAIDLKQTNSNFDADKQALFIISSIEGIICTAKAHNSLKHLHNGFEVINDYIESL
ncbi:MAG: TetR family transcriptional regulator [Helicobacteraceae bacterium]|nr:TetR family transcriptional regulator [Helicobacteraceae bacterium]